MSNSNPIGARWGSLSLSATLTILAGCGDSDSVSSAPKTGEALCSLPSASPAHVESVLGLSGLEAPDAMTYSGSTITSCGYVDGGPVTISFRASADQSSFESDRQGYVSGLGAPAVDYPGFGDKAYTQSLSATSNCLGVLKGSWSLHICTKAPVEKIQVLATDLFADLGA
jgi:hypothetical protein